MIKFRPRAELEYQQLQDQDQSKMAELTSKLRKDLDCSKLKRECAHINDILMKADSFITQARPIKTYWEN